MSDALTPILTLRALACAAAVLALAVGCDRGEPASSPEPSSTERQGQPEPAVEGARAERPDIGVPEEDLSRADVQRLCGTGCSGTVCIEEDRRCDCVELEQVCQISGCRDDASCGGEDQGASG